MNGYFDRSIRTRRRGFDMGSVLFSEGKYRTRNFVTFVSKPTPPPSSTVQKTINTTNRSPISRAKSLAFGSMLCAMTLCVGLLFAEGVIRLKNASMKNYDIEMWRYSKELKVLSPNPILGHEHRRSTSAVLQSVNIQTNKWGLRGGAIATDPGDKRRIMLLGSSITLGWGVPQEQTMASRLEDLFAQNGQPTEVLNTGVGNYNTVRYVELFLDRLYQLNPTDVVVHYFINDAEVLPPPGNNWLLRHSQLAVSVWSSLNRFLVPTGWAGLQEHYQNVYSPGSPGFAAMKDALKRLSDYAKKTDIRLYLAITPDVHNLKDYPYRYIHEALAGISQEYGYVFIDLYPHFAGLEPEAIWAMPGDPHPNALGHEIMARAVYPVLTGEDPAMAAVHH